MVYPEINSSHTLKKKVCHKLFESLPILKHLFYSHLVQNQVFFPCYNFCNNWHIVNNNLENLREVDVHICFLTVFFLPSQISSYFLSVQIVTPNHSFWVYKLVTTSVTLLHLDFPFSPERCIPLVKGFSPPYFWMRIPLTCHSKLIFTGCFQDLSVLVFKV